MLQDTRFKGKYTSTQGQKWVISGRGQGMKEPCLILTCGRDQQVLKMERTVRASLTMTLLDMPNNLDFILKLMGTIECS